MRFSFDLEDLDCLVRGTGREPSAVVIQARIVLDISLLASVPRKGAD